MIEMPEATTIAGQMKDTLTRKTVTRFARGPLTHKFLWLNRPDDADADYYITADGASGRIVELVRAGVPYCLFYAHWQGLNPSNGAGWDAFTRVIGRVQKHLSDRIVWMRPSAFTAALHAMPPGNRQGA